MVNRNKNNDLGKNSINTLINLFQNKKYKDAELLEINISKKFPNEIVVLKILGIKLGGFYIELKLDINSYLKQ